MIIGLIQPILYLVFFGPLLTKVACGGLPGFPPGNSYSFFVPGLLIQLGLFGAAFVGFAIIADWRAGVIERFRVTPVSRTALLAGRVLRDVVTLLVQAVVLVLAGLAFGMRAPFAGVLIGLAFIAVVAISLSAISYTVGLLLKSEDALAPADQHGGGPADAAVGHHAADDAGPRLAAGHLTGDAVPVHHRRHAPGVPRRVRGHGHGRGRRRGGGPGRGLRFIASRAFVRENA